MMMIKVTLLIVTCWMFLVSLFILPDLKHRILLLEGKVNGYERSFSKIVPSWDIEKGPIKVPVSVSMYTSRKSETDDTPHVTANNTLVRPGVVAVSRDLWKDLKDKIIFLEGYGLYKVTDKMNKRFEKAVDIWCGDLEAARLHGRQETKLIYFKEKTHDG